MKKNPLLEELRAQVTDDIKREIDLSFDIANRIHTILEKKNMTQRDLAHLLNKSEAEISKWMRGTHVFTTKTIAKIEQALGQHIIEVTGNTKKEYSFLEIPIQSTLEIPKSEKSTAHLFLNNKLSNLFFASC